VPASGDRARVPDPGTGRARGLGPAERDLPSRTDRTVAALSGAIGGPVGAHALIGRQRFFTPLRVTMLLTVIALAIGWLGKAACLQQYEHAPGELGLDWRGSRQYVALCYSDAIPLYSGERLAEGLFPYKSGWTDGTVGADGVEIVRHMEYPVLTGLYQYVTMLLTKAWTAGMESGWLPGALEVVVYFNLIALGLALAWLLTVRATFALTGRRPWDAALVALSPLVMVHAFTNFDALATAAAMCGLWAWSRRRHGLAGVLLGVGAAAKMFPIFLLGPLLVLCLRAGRMRQWWRAALAAALTFTAVNLPIAVLYPDGWREFFRLNQSRGMDPDSIYNVISSFTGWAGFDGPLQPWESPSILNAVSMALFLAACAAVGVIAMTARRRPRVAQLAFLVVAAFLLTNMVSSPQFSLWLVPLAVLALPHRRLLLGWMVIDALVWAPRMYYFLGVDDMGLPEQWFTATVLVRDVAVVALCALVIRQIYRPAEDLVRAEGVDDPVGGVLDGAADVRVWRRRPPPDAPPQAGAPAAGVLVTDGDGQ